MFYCEGSLIGWKDEIMDGNQLTPTTGDEVILQNPPASGWFSSINYYYKSIITYCIDFVLSRT